MTSDIFTLADAPQIVAPAAPVALLVPTASTPRAARGNIVRWIGAPRALAPYRPRFRTSNGDVCLRTARLSPETVDGLLTLFQRERAWALFDDLLSARDGATEPPDAA